MKITLPKIKKPEFKKPEFKKPDMKAPEFSFNFDEGSMRKIWAGEIAVGVLLSFVSIVVAFAG